MTLAVSSLRKRLGAKGASTLAVEDIPDFAIGELSLRGLNIPASLLRGWALSQFDRLRDRADKAGCPCLVLIEEKPISFIGPPSDREQALDRINRLATAATRLGCNSLSIQLESPKTRDAFDMCISGIREAIQRIERMELTLLLGPGRGLTEDPTELTEVIKKVGGFRIGSLPSFAQAAATGQIEATLKKLAPYAGSLHASINTFDAAGIHKPYDLVTCLEAIQSVGYMNTLAIEYLGNDDPVGPINQARDVLAQAIEALAQS